MFLAIKHVVLEMGCSDTIFISGHTHLGTYQSWTGNGIRAEDQVFTVIREPLDCILSQVNYVLTRIFSVQSPAQPDTVGWRKLFAIEDLDQRESRDWVVQLARRILRNKGVVVPNVTCAYLGGAGYDESLAKTVAHDLEVIELKHLDSWSEERLGVTRATRLNTSEKFVSINDFSPDDLDYARSIVTEDSRYYQAIASSYERHGKLAVKGAQIGQ